MFYSSTRPFPFVFYVDMHLIPFDHKSMQKNIYPSENKVLPKNLKYLDQLSTTWIENLAIQEINMEETGVALFDDHLNPEIHLEESSLQLMNQLRDLFEHYLLKFNELRSKYDTASSIKVFKISNTVNDFMLFRHSLKLVVGRKSNSLISIGFLSNTGQVFSARLNQETPTAHHTHELKAHLGVFNKIIWLFQGEEVDLHALVKYYLTEFIKCSAR